MPSSKPTTRGDAIFSNFCQNKNFRKPAERGCNFIPVKFSRYRLNHRSVHLHRLGRPYLLINLHLFTYYINHSQLQLTHEIRKLQLAHYS